MTVERPPNVVFMHSHNTGRFVEPYGHAVPTPNLRRLAEEGVLFRQAFCTAPTCSPSRASFLSGMYPHSCGMYGLGHRGFRMTDPRYHVVHTLGRNGYHTALAGVEHTAPDPTSVGYAELLSTADANYPELADVRDPVEAAVAFLGRDHARPFFLSLGLNATHRPFPPPDPANHPAEDERYCAPPPPLPDVPEIRADMAGFKASAREMDEAYGAVLRALDANGLADRTLVCCFTDHGLQFPRHMSNLEDPGIAVYLIVRGPGGFAGGRVVDEMASLMDLAPTVYDLAGIERPAFAQGASLRPLAAGGRDGARDAVFAESNYHAAYEPMRCIRGKRYKYIRRFDDRDRPNLPNVDDTAGKTFLLEQGWRDRACAREALYDLVFDPYETNNLCGLPMMREVADDMRGRLEAWMRETGDPLLDGGVAPAPRGALANDPEGESPNEPVMTIGPG